MIVKFQTTMPQDANGVQLEEGIRVAVDGRLGVIVAAYPALDDGADVTVQFDDDATYTAMAGVRCVAQ